MSKLSQLFRTALIPALLVGFGQAAHAADERCGIRSSSSTTATIVYDPFNPSGLPTTTVTLMISRINPSGGGHTGATNIYLKSNNTGADGTQIVPIGYTGAVNVSGIGYNIFYNYNEAPPIISPASAVPSASQRFLHMDFTGNNAASDTATVQFQVTLPSNLDVNAANALAFDVYWSCYMQGGNNNGDPQEGSEPNAIVFPIQVLSALQATYAGTALDFGEVGDKTSAEVLAAPAAYTTPTTNHVRVRSSGPYSVALTSQNNYRLTFPGGNLGVADQVLRYRLNFLGQSRDTNNPNFTTVTCQRAGVPASAADMLPVTATLLEGGQGKLVSASYADTLTVTVTPLLSGAPSQQPCPAL